MPIKMITVPNPARSRKWGWGWTATPTGRDAYSIEIPSVPDYTGTLNQVQAAIASDRTYASMRSGGTFVNTAWFYAGQRILNRDALREWMQCDGQTPVTIEVEISEASAAAATLGRAKSDKKTAAARANGKRGGRPRKNT